MRLKGRMNDVLSSAGDDGRRLLAVAEVPAVGTGEADDEIGDLGCEFFLITFDDAFTHVQCKPLRLTEFRPFDPKKPCSEFKL